MIKFELEEYEPFQVEEREMNDDYDMMNDALILAIDEIELLRKQLDEANRLLEDAVDILESSGSVPLRVKFFRQHISEYNDAKEAHENKLKSTKRLTHEEL